MYQTPAASPPWAGENILLALRAAYVDTLGLVAMFGLFTAHVTGNFILIVALHEMTGLRVPDLPLAQRSDGGHKSP